MDSYEYANEPSGPIKAGEISWLAEWLSAPQESFCSVELVSWFAVPLEYNTEVAYFIWVWNLVSHPKW
jgi:hypothetical protein